MSGGLELVFSNSTGTCFEMLLPSDDGTTTADSAPAVHAKGKEATAVYPWALILEDNASLRGLLQQVFESLEMKVFIHEEAGALMESAAKLAKEGDYGLCILDVTIKGGLGGLDVVEPLRKLLPKAKIILSSGHSDQWESWQLELGGLDVGFLPKPFSIQDLRRTAIAGDSRLA